MSHINQVIMLEGSTMYKYCPEYQSNIID